MPVRNWVSTRMGKIMHISYLMKLCGGLWALTLLVHLGFINKKIYGGPFII